MHVTYRDYINETPDSWLARWESFLLGQTVGSHDVANIEGYNYPLELAEEVIHIRKLNYEEIGLLNVLVDFWMAKKDRAIMETDYGVNRTIEPVWVRLKISEIQDYNIGFITQTILKLRDDTTTALTDEEKEHTLRIIPNITLIEGDKGNTFITYQVDWDVARLGFPEQYHEKEKAWQSIQYRFSNGLQDVDSITEAHVFVQNARDFSEYQKFVGENEKYAKELADDALKRYPSLRKLTGKEREEKLEEKCFNLWLSRKKMGMLGTEERWKE